VTAIAAKIVAVTHHNEILFVKKKKQSNCSASHHNEIKSIKKAFNSEQSQLAVEFFS
jgi:hypothetical protein